jgi:hypothetical protein
LRKFYLEGEALEHEALDSDREKALEKIWDGRILDGRNAHPKMTGRRFSP